MVKLKQLLLEWVDKEYHKIGYDANETYSDFPINWDEKDVQILNKWDIDNIRGISGKSKKFVAIYKSILDVNDLDPRLAEDDNVNNDDYDDEIDGGYDWSEFSMKRRGFPPILVKRDEHGYITIMDGNHRTYYAQQNDYKTIGAWVVDEFLQKIIDSRKK